MLTIFATPTRSSHSPLPLANNETISKALKERFSYSYQNPVTDLTQQIWDQSQEGAINLKLPFCRGRELAIEEIIDLLDSLANPTNVIVHGPAGVGKTTLIHELARRLLLGEAESLNGKHLLLMSPACSSRDLEFLAADVGNKAILVFDECHLSLTSQETNFSWNARMDVFSGKCLSENCKTLLGARNLLILGFTNHCPDSFLTTDPARYRRFKSIQLQELSIDQTLNVLREKNFEGLYCNQFKKTIFLPDATLRTAIYLSMIYCKEVALPTKVYLILDPVLIWYERKFRNQSLEPSRITPEILIQFMVEKRGHKIEDVREALENIEQLQLSQISMDEPLMKCSTSLSAKARLGKLTPAWGRKRLMEQLNQTLGHQMEYNNILLLGPPGTGKSRVAEGFAVAIQEGTFPDLQGKEILLLNWEMASKNLPEFLKNAQKYAGKFILVIDEAHQLAASMPSVQPLNLTDPFQAVFSQMSHGPSHREPTVFDKLKEATGRGSLPLLLLSTPEEAFRLTQDEAITRRLKIIDLEPLPKEDILDILEREIPSLNKRYSFKNLSIVRDTIETIYYLSKIYHPKEHQPSAVFRICHSIYGHCHRLPLTEETEISMDLVINAIAEQNRQTAEEVKEALRKEKAADHPSADRIPSGTTLRKVTTDWTREARVQEVPPNYVGYEDSFQKLIEGLSTPTCNNVILIGPAGCGKTTLVRRLAALMASPVETNIPIALRNKPLLALQLDELANPEVFAKFVNDAGIYGGQFVLFIDEIHRVLYTNSKEVNALKPLLSEGKITLIGATTENDLGRTILQDVTIGRRFTDITITPPTPEEAIPMLQNIQHNMEQQVFEKLARTVTFETETLRKAAQLADPNGLPASAIKILEQGAVHKALGFPNSTQDPITISPSDLSTPTNPKKQPSFLSTLASKFFSSLSWFFSLSWLKSS